MLSAEVLKKTLENIKGCTATWKNRLILLITNEQEYAWREAGYGSFFNYLKEMGCDFSYYHTTTSDIPTVLPAIFTFNVVPTCYQEKIGVPAGCITIQEAIENGVDVLGINYDVLTEGPFVNVDIIEALGSVFEDIDRVTGIIGQTPTEVTEELATVGSGVGETTGGSTPDIPAT
jgi:hypothetical protein